MICFAAQDQPKMGRGKDGHISLDAMKEAKGKRPDKDDYFAQATFGRTNSATRAKMRPTSLLHILANINRWTIAVGALFQILVSIN